jgi:ubiquinone/menaquinone biosynthesis C-methylase UbiE
MTQVTPRERRARSVSLDLDSLELASTYDKRSVRQFNHGKVLIDLLRVKPGDRVLDVGCTTGRLTEYAAERVAPNGHVVGIDPLRRPSDLAARNNPRVSVQAGRADDLSSLAANSFDVAYLNGVLHRVVDQPRALREALRVLKPGGRIGLNSADADRSHQGATLVREAIQEEGFANKFEPSSSAGGHRLNARRLLQLLGEAGFLAAQVTARTFVDDVADADDVFAWSSSNPFGSCLSELAGSERCRVRERVARKLEALRAADRKIRLERYLLFATAHKG